MLLKGQFVLASPYLDDKKKNMEKSNLTYLIEFLKWSSAGFFTVQLFRSHKSASDAFSSKNKGKINLNITFNHQLCPSVHPDGTGNARTGERRSMDTQIIGKATQQA